MYGIDEWKYYAGLLVQSHDELSHFFGSLNPKTIMISLFVIGIVSIGFYLYAVSKPSHPNFRKLIGYPFIGNLFDFNRESFSELPKKYGDFIELNFFTIHAFIITDLELTKDILMKRPKKFSRLKSSNYSTDLMLLSDGLFHVGQGKWNYLRRLTAPSFSNLNIENKFSNILNQLILWVERLKHKETSEIDMKFESFSLTIRVITVMAFGLSPETSVCQYFYSKEFLDDLRDILAFLFEFGVFPFPIWMWKLSRKYEFERKAVNADERFTEGCKQVIEYKRTHLQENEKSMLNYLLEAQEKLSMDELISNCKIFFIAGSDTTSVLITWASFYLSLDSNIQNQVRQEANELLNKIKDPKKITIHHVKQLSYALAVVKETLRLREPVTALSFEAEDKPVTLSNGLTLYPHQAVWVNIEGIQHKDPPFHEPEKFNPERWLTSDRHLLGEMESHLLSFGYGPRLCPGMNLAYQEATLAIAFLVYNFELTLNCPAQEISKLKNTISEPNKMPIKLTFLHLN